MEQKNIKNLGEKKLGDNSGENSEKTQGEIQRWTKTQKSQKIFFTVFPWVFGLFFLEFFLSFELIHLTAVCVRISFHTASWAINPFRKHPLRKCYGNNNSPSSKIWINIQKHHIFTSKVLPCSTLSPKASLEPGGFQYLQVFLLGDSNSSIFTFENQKKRLNSGPGFNMHEGMMITKMYVYIYI